jgi:hypothetical protein
MLGVYLFREPSNPPESKDLKAAIIDGLSEEFPNPEFVKDTTDILNSGGYRVDYYNSSKVTVDMYKNLPENGYNLIILRIHSAPMDGNSPGAAFFTSESQQGLYFTEQLLGWVRRAKTLTRGDRYYAVTPGFFVEAMKGNFNDTVLVTMSCYGAIDDTMANIFLAKGAEAYLGWDEKVTANHMDEITHILLREYIDNEKTLQESVSYVMEEHGSDPFYDSKLILFTRDS